MYDLIIKNGLIIDGMGEEGFRGDIGIVRDTIVSIGSLSEEYAKRVINANGLVVTPGFIDTHSHSDLKLLEEPYLEPKVRQGITTELLGQDGISVAPVVDEYLQDWKQHLSGLLGEISQEWQWRSIADYRKTIKRNKCATNVAYLVPHGNLRMIAVGLENRNALPEELNKMKNILEESLVQGAFGLSTGLIYAPCLFANNDELVELCKIVQKYDGVFVVHQRSEGDTILQSMDEVILIAKLSGVRVHFSHFKIAGKKNWVLIDKVLEKIAFARLEGVDISLDQYPYTAGSTMLSVILPPWVHDGGTDCLLKRLQTPYDRKKIKIDVEKGIHGWDNFVEWAGWDGIYITSVKSKKNQKYLGCSLLEIAEKNDYIDSADAAFDLLIEEENAVGMIDFVMDEHTISKIMQDKNHMFCTDGLLGGNPHPRAFGAFPRVINRYVREKKVLPLSEAIMKMTYVPAKMMGLKDRGILKEGYKADLVIFDYDTIKDTATYANPRQFPDGINYVVINGEIILEDNKRNQLLNGEFLVK